MSWVKANVAVEVADYLFNIKIKLPDRVGPYARDIRPDIIIDFEMLEEQLAETPEMIAFWDLLLAEQKAKVATLERGNRYLRGVITQELLGSAGDRELRRSDLKDVIEADPRVADIEARLILEMRNEDKLRAVINALQKKSEHLRSLAGFKRVERNETRA